MSGTWGRDWRLEEVKEYLGHTSITATQRYAHLSPKAMRAAVAGTACAALDVASIVEPQRVEIEPAPAVPAAASIIRRHQHGPTTAPKIALAAHATAETSTISSAHPPRFERGTCGLEVQWAFFGLLLI